MDVHLFTSNGLNIAFDPIALTFFVIPDSHVQTLRRLIARGDEQPPAHTAIERQIVDLFRRPSLPATTASFAQRVEGYRMALNRFTLILTDRCTLRCRYCYEGSESNPRDRSSVADLDTDTLRGGLEFVFSQYRRVNSIMFFGGEPLLRPDLIRAACRQARSLAESWNVALGGFGMVTNGTVLTEAVVRLIQEEKIGVTLSCDGPRPVNDEWRVWPGGEGSFRWIETAALRLKTAGVPFGIQAALTPLHAHTDCGTREIGSAVRSWTSVAPHVVVAQISPEARCAWLPQERDWLVSMYCREARAVLAQIERGNVNEAQPFTRMISILKSLVWRKGMPLRCPAGGEIALAPNGWIYPCFMFAGNGVDLRLCSVRDVQLEGYWQRLDAFITANLKSANEECSHCWARLLCSGCMGANLQVGGRLDANEPVNCRITKSLAETIMGGLAEIQSDPQRWCRFQENYRRMCGGANGATGTVPSEECP